MYNQIDNRDLNLEKKLITVALNVKKLIRPNIISENILLFI